MMGTYEEREQWAKGATLDVLPWDVATFSGVLQSFSVDILKQSQPGIVGITP